MGNIGNMDAITLQCIQEISPRGGIPIPNGTTPAHFGCNGLDSIRNTIECINRKYHALLDVAKPRQTRTTDEFLRRLGIIPESLPDASAPLHELFLRTFPEYAYLLEADNGRTMLHANYISALIYAVCIQWYPEKSPPRYRIFGNTALALLRK